MKYIMIEEKPSLGMAAESILKKLNQITNVSIDSPVMISSIKAKTWLYRDPFLTLISISKEEMIDDIVDLKLFPKGDIAIEGSYGRFFRRRFYIVASF